MSDTPETDASEHDIDEIPAFPFVSCNFARKLERERDEALKQIKANHDGLAMIERMLYEARDQLDAERALADRLAEELKELLHFDLDVKLDRLKSSKDALAAWREARHE